MRPPVLLILLSLSVLSGCPDAAEKTKTKTADAQDKTAKSGNTKREDPLAGSGFTKQELFAIYAAEMAKDKDPAGWKKVMLEQRMIDAQGNAIAPRQDAFDKALGRYAEGDREGWSKFLESLPE